MGVVNFSRSAAELLACSELLEAAPASDVASRSRPSVSQQVDESFSGNHHAVGTTHVRPPEVRVKYWEKRLGQLAVEMPNVSMLSLESSSYPLLLRLISDAPPFLFTDGSLRPEQDAYGLAIVGSRKASRKGVRVAYEVAAEAAGRGITVVSGLAEGIDSAAHLGAMEAGGRTIAVLGSGIDVVASPGNTTLAPRVRRCGCLVSQFRPGTPPRGPNFLLRNRVVSGLSLASLLVEGGEISGTRDEAQHALSQGRRVLAWEPSFRSASWLYELERGAEVKTVDSPEAVFAVLGEERDQIAKRVTEDGARRARQIHERPVL